jgi:hypothetical protein
MHSLEQAVSRLTRSGASLKKNRAAAVTLLDQLLATFKDCVNVWQGYLNSPGSAGDRWTQVSWIGSERAKQLHELSLNARDAVHRFCKLSNERAVHDDLLEESPVIQAYRMLKPGETGPDAARAAVETMDQRIAVLMGFKKRLANAVPVKKAAARKSPKKGKKASAKSGRRPAKGKSKAKQGGKKAKNKK